ncbi:alanyl-tRNA editing protein [Pseudoflavonifractor sp. 60]|uniref:alanyl-tRNA editing protein n=1 Tax=Pseudoflavonifractor sp. 60 TaxID=2304576 RepID=UPI00136EDD74|nr:alanyl-tRNA editing protein [Pseudoflavonifractor sp. 60]NBI67808.1 alanyl-tRNA editing protein [Pseudoflavonifractor sp. 60]
MEKLYEKDPFLIKFQAQVLSCTQGKKGFDIVLDRTAFYPEGGGQPYDTGRLEVSETRVQVLEVHSRSGQVVHTCDKPLEEGTAVTGIIDWDRRFDLMQQHSGEHIVSGLAHALWGCENVGFHLGAEVVTIDLSLPLTSEQCLHLEEDANRYIWLDIPVEISFPPPEKLAALQYRSKKELSGQVRIVEFPGADCCACCGTHVRSSGQVGLIKLLSSQKFREGVRIELVCGNRALRYLNQLFQQNSQVSHLLSAKPLQTDAAVERLLEENAALKSRVLDLEEARFAQLAAQYAGPGDVVLFEEGLTPDGLRRLCDAVLHACGGSGFCACFSGDDSSGYKYAIGQLGGELKEFTQQLNQALHGRGGGKPDFVQGSVQASQAEIKSFFQGRNT